MWSFVGGRMLRPLLLVPLLIVVLSVTAEESSTASHVIDRTDIGMLSNCADGQRCDVKFNYLTQEICSKEAVFIGARSDVYNTDYTGCESNPETLSCSCSPALGCELKNILKKTNGVSYGSHTGLPEHVNITVQCLRNILGEGLIWSDEKFKSYAGSRVPYTESYIEESAVKDCFKEDNKFGCYLKFKHLRGRWCSAKDLGMEVHKLTEHVEYTHQVGCDIFKDFMACKCINEYCPDITTLLPLSFEENDKGLVRRTLRGGYISDFKATKWCVGQLVGDLAAWDGTFSDDEHIIPKKVYIFGDQFEAPPRRKDPAPSPAAVVAPSVTCAPTSTSTLSFGIASVGFFSILVELIL